MFQFPFDSHNLHHWASSTDNVKHSERMSTNEASNALEVRDQDLASKVAVVTGASKGIGRAIAINLAIRGCNVLGTCSSPESLHLIDSVAHEISSLY